MAQQPLKIEFVSDVVCPWCAIGLASLEQALDRLGPEVAVELSFQPFELNPQMGPEGEDIDEHLVKKYGGTPAQFEASRANIRARGAALGFTFGQRTRIWNTFDAHRLLHWAGLEGRQHELKRALLEAYHGQGRNPADPAVLAEVAAAVGLDGARAAQILATDEFAAEVRAEEQQWLRLGIHSVPSVVVNRRHLIQGGQPPEVFEQALREIATTAA
ncbi:MAG: DsbA family oxidoreductase [Rubrivivax sp.]